MFGSIATMRFACHDYDYDLYCFGNSRSRQKAAKSVQLRCRGAPLALEAECLWGAETEKPPQSGEIER